MNLIVRRQSGRAPDTKVSHSVVEVWCDGTIIHTCAGLEPDFDEVKEMGGSRIPEGTYALRLRNEGAMTARYSERFPTWFKGSLHVKNVENYENIYIHAGNTAEDTAGCLLVGKAKSGNSVTSSVSALRKLYEIVIQSVIMGEATIQYLDEEE